MPKLALFWVGLSLCHCFFASFVTTQNVSVKLGGWSMKVLMGAKSHFETGFYK
jgi:uncharacterized protein YodC (DUF2158 family)